MTSLNYTIVDLLKNNQDSNDDFNERWCDFVYEDFIDSLPENSGGNIFYDDSIIDDNNNLNIIFIASSLSWHLPIDSINNINGPSLYIEKFYNNRHTYINNFKEYFKINSIWFQGSSRILTYHLEELMGTKLRALFQRKKGRDLFDFWFILKHNDIDLPSVVEIGGIGRNVLPLRISRRNQRLRDEEADDRKRHQCQGRCECGDKEHHRRAAAARLFEM